MNIIYVCTMEKFIAVPSFVCVNFWSVHVCYINMHLPLFFDVVCTHKYIVYQQIMTTMLSQHYWNIAIRRLDSIPLSSVASVSVPFIEFHKHALFLFWYESAKFH